jgi:pimeloyl-ACP methyl ester carboxylesterase
MPTVDIDGIATRYELRGSGEPLLMFSPGGFDAKLDNWTSLGVYRQTGVLERLTSRYTCVLFDRREAGLSGGRVQRLAWSDYVAQGKGLLDHLGIARAHLMGGCVGCSIAAAFAVAHPSVVRGMVLYSPAGGPRYRMRQHERFAAHATFVASEGLDTVVSLARSSTAGFSQDPRVGPWCTVLRTDPAFGLGDRLSYLLALTGSGRALFDRDTVPGAEPEDLMLLDTPALIVPGQDASHATSAARYLQECLEKAEYWDVPVAAQTPDTAPSRVLDFLTAL